MNIIIPLGGLGTRFLETGYTIPKPLINLLLKPILFWLLDCLSLKSSDHVVIVCNKRLKQYRFKELVNKSYKNITVMYLDNDTRGAAETVLLGLSATDLKKPTILLDGDTFYNVDILNLYRTSENKNVVFSFKQQDSRPIYSYVRVVDGVVKQIAEKQPISELANTGAYAFEAGEILKKYCEIAIEKFDSSKQKELYTSSIISDMIKDHYIFTCCELKDDDFEVVGTPLQYKLFHNRHKNNKEYFKKYRICFDLDNTLVTHPQTPGDYTTVQPIDQNIKYAKFLHDLGCTVIIYTARRMKTHHGNVGSIVSDVGKITLDTLEKYQIPCDEIYFGKPYAHAYIDDLAFNAFDDFPFQLGLTDHHVKERDFNTVQSKTLQVFEKKSINPRKLQAEVFWYENIPNEAKRHTPKVLSNDVETGSYLMEKIDGITFSELLVSQSLSESVFEKLLETLCLFHQHEPENINFDPYSVYVPKLEQRFKDYNYTKFPESQEVYATIKSELNTYTQNGHGVIGCIHGDPVFSNVLVDRDSMIKLVDPRGLTADDQLCVFGDVMYDYAKILQSLCGYDEILLTGDRFLDNTSLIKKLNTHVRQTYGEQYVKLINTIKNSLLFTLIPLHDNKNCDKFYDLIVL